MAFIRSVEVDSLAAKRTSLRFTLNRDVNVFFGANGSGKTSLLRILHSAMSSRAKDLRRIAFSDATVEFSETWVVEPHMPRAYQGALTRTTLPPTLPPDQIPLSAEMAAPSLGRVGEKKTWRTIPEELDSNRFELRHTYLPISRLYVTEDRRVARMLQSVSTSPGLSELDLDRVFTEMVNLMWLRYTRNTSLEIEMKQTRGIGNILADFITSEVGDPQPVETDVAGAYQRLQAFLERQSRTRRAVISLEAFEKRLKEDPRMRLVLRNIEEIEADVALIKKPKNEFERLLKSMISPEKELRLGDRDIHAFGDTGEIQLEDLSSGEKQLLRICVDALLADGEPILIDEPELSMHIDWQRKFLPALRVLAPDSQLIIATHSPEILAPIRNDQIFEL